MGSSSKFSRSELFIMLILLQHGGYFWMLPHLVTLHQGSIGILSLTVGAAVGLGLLVICCSMGKAAGEENIIAYLRKNMGNVLGSIIGLLLCCFFALFTIINISSFTDMIGTQLLPHTPRWALLLISLLLIGKLVYNGLEDIARFAVISMFFLAGVLLLVIAGNVELFSIERVLPVQIKEAGVFWGGFRHAASGYGVFLCLLMIYPKLNQKKKVLPISIGALAVAFITLQMIVVMGLGVFGQQEIGRMLWVPLELAQMIKIGPFLERLEGVFVMLWVVVIFVNNSLLVYCVHHSWADLLKIHRSKKYHWFMMLVMFLILYFVNNLFKMFVLQYIYSQYFIWLMLAVLVFAWLISWIRSRKKGANQHA